MIVEKYIVEHDGEQHPFDAISYEDAASQYARYHNEDGDYALMNETERVAVFKYGTDLQVEFDISAEPDIHYIVTERES